MSRMPFPPLAKVLMNTKMKRDNAKSVNLAHLDHNLVL